MVTCPACKCRSVVSEIVSCEPGLVCSGCGLVLQQSNAINDDANTDSIKQQKQPEKFLVTAAEFHELKKQGKEHSFGLYSSLPKHLKRTGGKVLREQKQFSNRRFGELKRALINTGTQLRFSGQLVSEACGYLETLLEDITNKRFVFCRKTGYIRLIGCCLLYVARKEGSHFEVPMSEVAASSGCSLREFFATYRNINQHFAEKASLSYSEHDNLEAHASPVAAVSKVSAMFERSLTEFCNKIAAEDFPLKSQELSLKQYAAELLELSQKILEYAVAKMHVERHARACGQVATIVVYVAWSVLALNWNTKGKGLLKPSGESITNTFLFRNFVKHYGFEKGDTSHKRLHELAISFVRESSKLPWIQQQCAASTVHKYIPGILDNYKVQLESAVNQTVTTNVRKHKQRSPTVEAVSNVMQDVYSERLTEHDLSDKECSEYIRTPAEILLRQRMLSSMNA